MTTPLEKEFIESILKRNYPQFVQCLCRGVNLKSYYQGQDMIQYIMTSYLPENMIDYFVGCALTQPYKNELLASAASFKPQYIKPLVEQGADINTQNKFGQTPLILSAKNERLVELEYLWNLGANPLIRDGTDFGCFSVAAFYRQGKVIDFYLSNLNSLALCQEFEEQLKIKNIAWSDIEQQKAFEAIKNKLSLEFKIKALPEKNKALFKL